MKALGIVIVSLLPISLLHADSAEQRQLDRYLALEQRIQQSCDSNVDSDLCQAWLQGMLHGVQAAGVQAEKMSSSWALVHEQDQKNNPNAWITRDVLNAVSCAPNALDFVGSYHAASDEDGEGLAYGSKYPSVVKKANSRRRAAAHVEAMCGPIWMAQRLEPSIGIEKNSAVRHLSAANY